MIVVAFSIADRDWIVRTGSHPGRSEAFRGEGVDREGGTQWWWRMNR